MLERLRAFLREIGPGGVRGGLSILLGTLALLVLSSVAIGFGLVASGVRKLDGTRAESNTPSQPAPDPRTSRWSSVPGLLPILQ